MPARLLYLAKPSPAVAPPLSSGDVLRAMLLALLPRHPSASTCLVHAAQILQRGLGFDMSGAYIVAPDESRLLHLISSVGFPPGFSEVAGQIPLSDFGDIADLPYNGDHAGCCGDFFAPVIGAFGARSWLIASLPDPTDGTVRAALLLGSRNPRRFGPDESRLVFSLMDTVREQLFSADANEQAQVA